MWMWMCTSLTHMWHKYKNKVDKGTQIMVLVSLRQHNEINFKQLTLNL